MHLCQAFLLTITKNHCAMTKTSSLRTQAGKCLHKKYEFYGQVVLGITRSQCIFDFFEKNNFTTYSIVPQILI